MVQILKVQTAEQEMRCTFIVVPFAGCRDNFGSVLMRNTNCFFTAIF